MELLASVKVIAEYPDGMLPAVTEPYTFQPSPPINLTSIVVDTAAIVWISK